MNPPVSLKIMALLALVQGAFGLLRAYGWIHIGMDLFREGLLILPAIGTVAVLRGMLIAAVGLLYFLFFCGVFSGSGWTWPVCLTAAVVNLLLVLNAVRQEAPLMEALVWSIIPVVLILYRFVVVGLRSNTYGSR